MADITTSATTVTVQLQGPQGATGPQGEQGIPGSITASGALIITGSVFASGSTGQVTASSHISTSGNVIGSTATFTDYGTISATSITASAEMSASGNVYGKNYYLSHGGGFYGYDSTGTAQIGLFNLGPTLLTVGDPDVPTQILGTYGASLTALSASFEVSCSGAVSGSKLHIDGSVINFSGLPTSDPGVAGYLWNDSNTLKISAG
tara:strand:- start:66 stop:683 length:618 start_codon:yes stop_codon:yes gene_type:complete